MARLADKNSKRQRGFKLLDGLRGTKRSIAIDKLMSKLDVGQPYAASIHAAHRTMGKEQGIYKTTYRVLDTKDGNTVKPYLSTREVFKPDKGTFTTKASAVKDYVTKQNRKINTALKLG